MSIVVTGVNDGPTAVDDKATTDEDTAVTLSVLANDTDPDKTDRLTVTSAEIASGLSSVSTDGTTVTYDPGTAYQSMAAGESATVEIAYAISDGNGGTTSALARVTVNGVNDAPVAVDDTAEGEEDGFIFLTSDAFSATTTTSTGTLLRSPARRSPALRASPPTSPR